MAEYCTCGAQLPEDALFCHKCGKPQREILAPEVEANTYPAAIVDIAPLPPQVQLEAPPLNFSNPVAVRIALIVAVSATILGLITPILNWPAAGFFAVYFYCRKTGFRLDVGAGVKIGWITGLMSYGFSAIFVTAQLLPDALSGHLAKTVVDSLKGAAFQDPATLQRVTEFIQTEPAVWMLVMLAGLFVFVTSLSMVGGALGAKLAGPK
jgi:uncharacterized membrane protein YphA (DoxX/SURF4 family)